MPGSAQQKTHDDAVFQVESKEREELHKKMKDGSATLDQKARYYQLQDHQAEYLKKYGTFQKFKSMFFIDSLLLESLYVYHVSDTTKMQKITGKDYDISINSLARERICTNLKARYAFFLFGPNESRMILNSQDKEYNAAFELINSPEEYYNVFDN